MERSEYQRLADACLAHVAGWLESFDPDELDFVEADGVVTLVFGDGTRFVLNRQAAASQMWFAAAARAWHFSWDPVQGSWVDDRDGHDLFEGLARAVSTKLGRPVALAAPPR